MNDHYPDGTVRALLKTDQVTEATRQVLTERLTSVPYQPQFFSSSEFALLQAICDRLIPQAGSEKSIDIAGGIDKRLTQHQSDGWRYDIMPADGDAYRLGLTGVDETSLLLFLQSFQQLADELQDKVLSQIQHKQAPGETWKKLSASRFFEELLTEAVTNYYSHPLAQEEIGYVGMADVPAWHRIGLNQLEDREPKRVKSED